MASYIRKYTSCVQPLTDTFNLKNVNILTTIKIITMKFLITLLVIVLALTQTAFAQTAQKTQGTEALVVNSCKSNTRDRVVATNTFDQDGKSVYNLPANDNYTFTVATQTIGSKTPQSGVTLGLTNTKTKTIIGTAVTNEKGEVVFNNVEAGTYSLAITKCPKGQILKMGKCVDIGDRTTSTVPVNANLDKKTDKDNSYSVSKSNDRDKIIATTKDSVATNSVDKKMKPFWETSASLNKTAGVEQVGGRNTCVSNVRDRLGNVTTSITNENGETTISIKIKGDYTFFASEIVTPNTQKSTPKVIVRTILCKNPPCLPKDEMVALPNANGEIVYKNLEPGNYTLKYIFPEKAVNTTPIKQN